MLEKDLRNEKGSITLFVLLAMLFFLIVIFGMFMTSSNKNSIQVSELDKIKKEYGESVDNIDQIYAEELEKEQKTIEDLKVGDKVYYDTGNTSIGDEGVIECIVLYDKAYNDENGTNYGVQIVSADVIYKNNEVDKVTLGVQDDFNASRDDYNNAFEILYNKAQEYLNVEDKSGTPVIATGARCVGSKPDDPDWDTNEMFTSSYSYMIGYNNTLKQGEDTTDNSDWIENTNNPDWIQMEIIYDIAQPSFPYWLTYRVISPNSTESGFYIPVGVGYYSMYARLICYVKNDGTMAGAFNSYGFRPVFTLKPGVKITEGDGGNTPYTLAP